VIADAKDDPADLCLGHLLGKALDIEPVHELFPPLRNNLRLIRELGLVLIE